jgi:hypothetical protein
MKKNKTKKKKTAKTGKPPKARAKRNSARKKLSRKARATRRTRRPVVEPSSGWATSSLDPHRAGRLAIEQPPPEARRGRQAGDDQGISRNERLDSESVEELLEEGQAFEASVIEGVEDALDADQGPVRTHQVPEDDVPPEYQDKDRI